MEEGFSIGKNIPDHWNGHVCILESHLIIGLSFLLCSGGEKASPLLCASSMHVPPLPSPLLSSCSLHSDIKRWIWLLIETFRGDKMWLAPGLPFSPSSDMSHYICPHLLSLNDDRNQNSVFVFTIILSGSLSLVWLGSLQSLLSLSISKIWLPAQSHPTLLLLLFPWTHCMWLYNLRYFVILYVWNSLFSILHVTILC